MSSQESDKNITGKIFPMDLVSKPSSLKSVDTTGIIKVPQGTTTTYRTIGQPQMRVLTQVPNLGQTTASGAQIISTHIVPQAVLKQVDATGRSQITTIAPRTATTIQTTGQPTRSVVSTTYHVPRGAAAVANISGPRASLSSSIRASSQGITTPTSATQLSTATNIGSQSTLGVTVGVPVTGFVRATTAPQRAPSPATPSTWLQGNTVQVQTVQVSNPSIVPQRIQTFTALGRPSHAIPNTRPAQGQIIHQAAQVHTFKPTAAGVSVQSLNTVLPVRTNQHQQGATLVYSNVSNPTQFTTAPRLAMTTVPQRIGQTRQIQVAGTRARLQVPTGTRITAIPVTNATNVIAAQPILTSNSHITLQTSASQPINITTVNTNNRSIVNNVGITRQGQLLQSGGTRINSNLSTTNLVVNTNSSNSNVSNTTLGSTNINTNIGSSNISGLVSLHPVLVTSGTPRTNHKIVAQISQTGGLKNNSMASIQPTIQTISVSNSNNSQATVGIVSNVGQNAPATRPVSIVGTASVGPRVVSGVSKVFQPTSESGIFLHRASPGVITTSDQKSTASYTLPTSYYYEAPSYSTSGNYTNNIPTTHGTRFNPIMVVEPSVSQNISEINSTSQSIVTLSTMSNPPKLTSSPRPSILRKRDHDGSPLKGIKNLTATSLAGSRFSPSERPDSEGRYAPSSGSTTVSATSSPGLDDDLDHHDDRIYSLNEDELKCHIDIRKYPDDDQKYNDNHYMNDDNKKYSGLNEENLRKFNMENPSEITYGFDERFKTEERREGIRTNREYNVVENRHKYMDKHDDKRINVSLIEGDVFKNDDNKNDLHNTRVKVIQEDDRPVEVSPRKKPRKQQLTSNELLEPKYNTDEMQFVSDNKSNMEASVSLSNDHQDHPKDITVRKPQASLLSTYHPNWKPSHNHFQRYTDVKPKDERRPSIIDLANQSHIVQKVNGWKIYHLSSQMEDMAEQEHQMHEELAHLLGVYDGMKNRSDTELATELLKGNMQRTQIVTDGLKESKVQVMRIFEHKDNVLDIITRCASKRNFKKRDK